MGIDKSNIRLVYHYGAPAALESYYQQVSSPRRDAPAIGAYRNGDNVRA